MIKMGRPIITLGDGTEVLETTGDVDALVYGGGVLYKDPDGNVFWTFWPPPGSGGKNYTVFTAAVPKNIIDHYRPDIKELELVTGIDPRSIRRFGSSRKPSDRLRIVMAICDCIGPSGIDLPDGPELLTAHDLASRWGHAFGVDPDDVPKLSSNDFIVRKIPSGQYDCGSVDGVYLGRHSRYREALCAIADFIDSKNLHSSNVYQEDSSGNLDLVVWEYKSFAGKVRGPKILSSSAWKSSMKPYVASEIKNKSIDKALDTGKSTARARNRAAAKISRSKRISRAKEIGRSIARNHGV